MDRRGRIYTRLLHELAHSTSGPHNKDFYDAQRFFMQVASTELGWPLDVNCRLCCHLATCSKEACPDCNWMEDPATCSAKSTGCGEQ